MNDANWEFGMKIKIASESDLTGEFFDAVTAARKKLEEDESFNKAEDNVLTDNEFMTTVDKGNGFIQAKLY